jgi:hypothetical protein
MTYLDYCTAGNKRVAARRAGEAAGLLFEAAGGLSTVLCFLFLFFKSGPVRTPTLRPRAGAGGCETPFAPSIGTQISELGPHWIERFNWHGLIINP